MTTDSVGNCCFCGKPCEKHAATIELALESGDAHELRSHVGCVADRVHSSVPLVAGAEGLRQRAAYSAMYAFLADVFERTQSGDLGALLGAMSLLPDGSPVDPAVTDDWARAWISAEASTMSLELRPEGSADGGPPDVGA